MSKPPKDGNKPVPHYGQTATTGSDNFLAMDEREESMRVKSLDEEFRINRDELQSSIEHFEQSSEELKISNEAVASIDEEQEISRAELQLLNKELSAVNQQLRNKITELEIANNNLNNLIASSDIAALCLDRRFHIKWFTPTLRAMFNLSDNDIGQPISEPASTLPVESLTNDAKEVIKSLTPTHAELQSQQGRWYLRRILPYRLDNRQIEGVIVTFTDITASKQAAERAIAEREKLLASLESRVDERTAQLRALAFDLTKSEEKERQSIARDLHDGLGQNLALAKLKLDYLRPLAVGTIGESALATVEKMIDQSNQSLRSLASQLCPPMLYDLGLVPALKWLADEMLRDHGLHIHIAEDDHAKPLDQSVQAILFRAVRELLINVTKHADASTVLVEVSVYVVPSTGTDAHQAFLKIVVSDNGKGFVPDDVTTTTGGGFGLINVRERLGYIGGNTEIVSAPNRGTAVTLTAPMSLHTSS